jgi:hypothetical protein
MLARDLLKVSVLYLPLLFTTLMLCATRKAKGFMTTAPSSAPRQHRPRHRRHSRHQRAATLFLFWLIYVHPAAATSTQYAFLPALNAVFNGLSATALLIGYTFIRAHRIKPTARP